jgi:hypothetical protein
MNTWDWAIGAGDVLALHLAVTKEPNRARVDVGRTNGRENFSVWR